MQKQLVCVRAVSGGAAAFRFDLRGRERRKIFTENADAGILGQEHAYLRFLSYFHVRNVPKLE